MSHTIPASVTRLSTLINSSRLALFGSHSHEKMSPTVPLEPDALEIPQKFLEVFQREDAPLPHVQVLPAVPGAGEVQGERKLTAGAARLWAVLHMLALFVARQRGHGVLPSHIVFHLPAVILAALAGYSERHTYRLADELKAAGLVDHRGYVSQVGKLRRYSGTLWAVKLMPVGAAPRLRFWDFQHDWRPDFAEDYYGEQGAFRAVQDVMSEPLTCEEKQGRLLALAKSWSAGTKTRKSPAKGGSDIRPSSTLQAVAYVLPSLIHLHPRQRHREVARLAADVSDSLGEPGRFKQWCGAIYRAIQAENEQRNGLQSLSDALCRLSADLAEGAPWKKPGAVLTARLK